jgi:hypothetical protein
VSQNPLEIELSDWPLLLMYSTSADVTGERPRRRGVFPHAEHSV